MHRVPETATILLGGGVVFSELNDAQSFSFQKNLLRTMMSIQDTYIEVGSASFTSSHLWYPCLINPLRLVPIAGAAKC